MRENQSDIAALQAGLKARKHARDGLRLYTADFDSVSLAGFYRGRSAFLMLSGPSLTQVDLTQLNRRGIVTMGVNNRRTKRDARPRVPLAWLASPAATTGSNPGPRRGDSS